MSKSTIGFVVLATDQRSGGVVFFDGAGRWTSDLDQAQIARSPVGRKALLRVASALTSAHSVIGPDLTAVIVPPSGSPLLRETDYQPSCIAA